MDYTRVRRPPKKIDLSKLQAGDIIFNRSSNPLSLAIRAQDGGPFSHALIYVGDGLFIEAVRTGSRVIGAFRLLVPDPDDWQLARIDDGALAASAATQARNLAHRPYNVAGIIRIALSGEPAGEVGLFCSQLIAEAYRRAGVDLGEPALATPAALFASSKLRKFDLPVADLEVADQVMLSTPKNEEISPTDADLALTRAAVDDVLSLVPTTIQKPENLPDLLQLIWSMPDFEAAGKLSDALVEALNSRGVYAALIASIASVQANIADAARAIKDPAFKLVPKTLLEEIAERWMSRSISFSKRGAELVAFSLSCFKELANNKALSIWTYLEKQFSVCSQEFLHVSREAGVLSAKIASIEGG